jgi:hypothetical protein
MVQADDGHGLEPELLGRLQAGVARDDAISLVDQDRIDEAELLDAVGDLLDLLLGMGTGIARIRLEIRDGDMLDLKAVHDNASQ